LPRQTPFVRAPPARSVPSPSTRTLPSRSRVGSGQGQRREGSVEHARDQRARVEAGGDETRVGLADLGTGGGAERRAAIALAAEHGGHDRGSVAEIGHALEAVREEGPEAQAELRRTQGEIVVDEVEHHRRHDDRP